MRQLLLALAALLVVMFFARPATPWEFDEHLFFQGLHHFDPAAHHPPPPGYPVFMGVGHLLRLAIPSDFATLVTMSFIASLAGFALFALAFGATTDDLTIGIVAALLFYFSPAMIVHATLPISDTGALGLLAAALYFANRQPALFALFAALAVGWRPQFSVFVVPLLLVSLIRMRWRDCAIALVVFTLICIAWLIPLAGSVGGVRKLIAFESTQAEYLAQHDAGVSRGGWTPAGIAFRFIAHPWGTKLMSFPILILAAIGIVEMVRRKEGRVFPVAAASFVYLAFALWVMDPADGVRYALPSVLGAALFAAVGVVTLARRMKVPVYAPAALLAAASVIYTSSFISQRSRTSSPPVFAAEVARFVFPKSAVPLYELPLWPHAQYYFGDRKPMRVNDGLAAYYNRPDVPLFLYADGVSHARGARVFRWQPSDAYSKLTRNHYRVVSLIPIEPDQRFRTISGIYAPEREPDGEEWRWLDAPAALKLPGGPPRNLIQRLGLPVIYPMERNTLTIVVNGDLPRVIALERGQPINVSIPVPAGSPIVRFEAQRSFIPAQIQGSLNRDARRLAVKLYDLRTSAAAKAVPQVASR